MAAMNKQKLSLDSQYMNKVPNSLQHRHKHGPSKIIEQNRQIRTKSDKAIGIKYNGENEENEKEYLKDRKNVDHTNNEICDDFSNFTRDSTNTTKTAMTTNNGITSSIISSDLDSTTFFDTEEDEDEDDDGQ
jgi:hypothetical protein